MEISEKLIVFAVTLIIVVAILLITIYLLDSTTRAYIIRRLTCGMLYVISFGGLTSTLSQGCGAVPA